MKSNNIEQLFENSDDLTVERIAESENVLSEQDKERIFNMSIKKSEIPELSMESKSEDTFKVEKYRRRNIFSISSVAAAAVIGISCIVGTGMLMHRAGSPLLSQVESEKMLSSEEYEAVAENVIDKYKTYSEKIETCNKFDQFDRLSFTVDPDNIDYESFTTEEAKEAFRNIDHDMVFEYCRCNAEGLSSLADVYDLEDDVFTEDYLKKYIDSSYGTDSNYFTEPSDERFTSQITENSQMHFIEYNNKLYIQDLVRMPRFLNTFENGFELEDISSDSFVIALEGETWGEDAKGYMPTDIKLEVTKDNETDQWLISDITPDKCRIISTGPVSYSDGEIAEAEIIDNFLELFHDTYSKDIKLDYSDTFDYDDITYIAMADRRYNTKEKLITKYTDLCTEDCLSDSDLRMYSSSDISESMGIFDYNDLSSIGSAPPYVEKDGKLYVADYLQKEIPDYKICDEPAVLRYMEDFNDINAVMKVQKKWLLFNGSEYELEYWIFTLKLVYDQEYGFKIDNFERYDNYHDITREKRTDENEKEYQEWQERDNEQNEISDNATSEQEVSEPIADTDDISVADDSEIPEENANSEVQEATQ